MLLLDVYVWINNLTWHNLSPHDISGVFLHGAVKSSQDSHQIIFCLSLGTKHKLH